MAYFDKLSNQRLGLQKNAIFCALKRQHKSLQNNLCCPFAGRNMECFIISQGVAIGLGYIWFSTICNKKSLTKNEHSFPVKDFFVMRYYD